MVMKMKINSEAWNDTLDRAILANDTNKLEALTALHRIRNMLFLSGQITDVDTQEEAIWMILCLSKVVK